MDVKGKNYAKSGKLPHFYLSMYEQTLKIDMLSPRVRKKRFFGQRKCVPLAGILQVCFTGINDV
jgi:hypothetical protein